MKAMIFAAGKGTRLKPLTDYTPKALVKVNGTPMLEIVIKKLIASGVNEIIINVHYLADQIIQFLKSKNNFGIRIEISFEKDILLNTGGGLKKAAWFFNDNNPFIVHNVDIISNIDLNKMLAYHQQNNSLATLAVRKRKTSRYFLCNELYELCGWENTKTAEKIISRKSNNLKQFGFSGIHIINPEIFNYLNVKGAFSIVPSYLELSANKKILVFEHTADYWFDIGKPDNLKSAEHYIKDISLS